MDDKPIKKSSKPKKQEEDWEDTESDTLDYDSMSPKALYDLCVEREIEAQKRKPKKYYINLLEEWDAAQNDWSDEDGGDFDEDEDDEWEDE